MPCITLLKHMHKVAHRHVCVNNWQNHRNFFKIKIIIFFLACERAEFSKSCNLIGSGSGRKFSSCPLTERFRKASSLCEKIELPYSKKKINKLFTGFGSVRIVKNCDLGLENAARGRRPRAAFSRPRSQFFTIWTPQPVNNIYFSRRQFYPSEITYPFETDKLPILLSIKIIWCSSVSSRHATDKSWFI